MKIYKDFRLKIYKDLQLKLYNDVIILIVKSVNARIKLHLYKDHINIFNAFIRLNLYGLY